MIDISGSTRIFPVIGWPVEQVKAPALFNAYFDRMGIDARVVPLKLAPAAFPSAVRSLMAIENVGGLFVSIPHKPAVVDAVDQPSARALLAGACNVVYRDANGTTLIGDLIDGEGFVRALERTCGGQAFAWPRASALVVGSGGVGCAVAAALAEKGIARIAIYDTRAEHAEALCERLRAAFPQLDAGVAAPSARGYDLVVNATPLGMDAGDPLPVDLDGIDPACIVADCGMKIEMTALLSAARARGCRIQKGKEMLLEQAPLYLALFGWPGVPADALRDLDAI